MNIIRAEVATINITGKPNGLHRSTRNNTLPARGQKKSPFSDAMAKAEAHKGDSAKRNQEKSPDTHAENLFLKQAAADEHNGDNTDGKLKNQSDLTSGNVDTKERQLETSLDINHRISLDTGREDRRASSDTGHEVGVKSAESSGTDMKQASITGVQSASRGSTHTVEKIIELSTLIDRLSDLNDSKANQWTVKILDTMSGVNEITLIRSAMQGWTIDVNLLADSLSNAQSNDLQALKDTLQKRGHKVDELSVGQDDSEQTN